MTSPWSVVKQCGPKLVPFFKSVAVFFVLFPLNAAPTLLFLIIKCIPIVALCLFVLMHGISFQFEYSYSRRIFTGLLFSMIGDACLVYKEDYFIFGVGAFAIAHIIYFTAFGIKPFNFRLAFALVAFGVPICAVYVPFISNYVLKIMVPVYISLLLLMLWRAVSRLQIFNTKVEWTWTKFCCSLGALFFVISDSILSIDLFIYDVPYSHPIIMLTYYAAQLGIALSVVDSNESHEVNHLVIQHGDLINGAKSIYKYVRSVCTDEKLILIDTDSDTAKTAMSTAATTNSVKIKKVE